MRSRGIESGVMMGTREKMRINEGRRRRYYHKWLRYYGPGTPMVLFLSYEERVQAHEFEWLIWCAKSNAPIMYT